MKTLKNENKILLIIVSLFVVIQPIVDMDYLIFPLLDSVGLPRLSTIIKFVLIPLLILYILIRYTLKNKKRTIFVIVYGLILLVYFYFHNQNAMNIFEALWLPNNFEYHTFEELVYFMTMIIPLAYIWISYEIDFSKDLLKKLVIILSSITSIPIMIGDLFVFARSTYSGYTTASILTWFSGIYEIHNPRTLASKFFFAEGNTIGILLFMILPLLYFYFYKEEKSRNKILLAGLIFIHSLSMIVLGTRIGTYGSVIVPVIVLAVYLLMMILRKETFKKTFLGIIIFNALICYLIIPYSPARQNQLIDNANDYLTLQDNYILDENRDGIKAGEALIPGSFEYNQFYIYYFLDNAFLINSTPKQYYTEWYYYQFDPKFWVDYIFNYDLEERVNGRQFEKIFYDYKWANLTSREKALGFSFSTFMNGSIVLEQDFLQHYYTYGYLGFPLIVMPWLILLLYLGFKVVFNPKKHWEFEKIVMMFSICAGLASAYVSGHVIDQFITSLLLAVLFAVMLKEVNQNDEETN